MEFGCVVSFKNSRSELRIHALAARLVHLSLRHSFLTAVKPSIGRQHQTGICTVQAFAGSEGLDGYGHMYNERGTLVPG